VSKPVVTHNVTRNEKWSAEPRFAKCKNFPGGNEENGRMREILPVLKLQESVSVFSFPL